VAAWLFVAAVVIRLAALAILGLTPDTFEYEEQAKSLLAGRGYQRVHLGTPHLAQGPPLFGFLCAGLYWVFGASPLPVILAQIGASALIPVVIARIATGVGLGRGLALVAGALAVVHPGLIVYAVHKLHPLSFDALLLSLSVLSVMRLVPASGLGSHVWAGLVLGLATLSRATVALFALPAVTWLGWIAPKSGRRRAAAGIVLFLGTAALIVLPWTARNYLVLHRFVFVTTDTAELFWRGNNPLATGSALLLDGRPVFAGAPEDFRRAVLAHDELGQVDLFRETAGAYLRERPGEFIVGVMRKWVSFWWFPATAGLYYPERWLLLYRVFYAVLLAGAILGIPAAWCQADRSGRQRVLLVLMMLGCISVAQSLFYVDVRHRWGVEPLLGIFLAAAVGRWCPLEGGRHREAHAGPAGTD
jgi:4-amino-4-deoxy-L-arabinose transferase-like glycosyltransferase